MPNISAVFFRLLCFTYPKAIFCVLDRILRCSIQRERIISISFADMLDSWNAVACSNGDCLAWFGCGFPWWMKPVDGCWIRIWCNGYAQKLLWIFFHLGHFIDFLELWTAIFGKHHKKASFQPFTLLFVLRWGWTLESGCWGHRETTGMAQSTLQCALGDFLNPGNPRK